MATGMKKIGDLVPQQGDLFEVDASWFHVFRDLVASGQLAEMTGSSVKVYLVIRAYANPASGDSFPSIDLIAEKTGLSRSQVKRELIALEDQGHVRKQKSGRHNVYNLLDKWPIKNASTGEVVRRVEVVPYIPKMVEIITKKLKAALMGGELPSAGPINLNLNMPVTINYAADGGTIIINGGSDQDDSLVIDADVVDMESAESVLDTLPEKMRDAMLNIRPAKS